MGKYVKHVKIAKNLLRQSEFQPSIFYRNRENHVSHKTFQTYAQTDISNYRVDSLLKRGEE